MRGVAVSRSKRWAIAGTACLLSLVQTGCMTATSRNPVPDLVLYSGHVLTGDSAAPSAQAIAIKDGRILAVGSDAEIGTRISHGTRVIELRGHTVIAGINDAHDHVGDAPFGTEAVTVTAPMADPPLAEVVDAVRRAASSSSEGSWIRVVVGQTVMQDARAANLAVGQAGGDHPVLLSAWWGHGVIASPVGLQRLHIDDTITDPNGGAYERDDTGHLTGKMEEYAGWSVLQHLHTEAGNAATIDALQRFSNRRIREGVTSAQIMAGYQKPDRFLAALDAASLPLRLRVVAFPFPDTNGDGMACWLKLPARAGDHIRFAGIKWILDGTPIEQLAYQTAAYPGRPDWFGRPNFNDDHIRAQLKTALDGGEQILLHVVGDAMAERVLTLMEEMAPPSRWAPRRVRIEHGNGLTGPRIARARKLGIVIAQPRPSSPIRAWIAAGIPVAYGSDMGFPPFVAFAQMTSPLNPNSVSREVGMAILTRGPAFAEFAEDEKGTLSPGKVADIVVLSQDPMTTAQDRLAGIYSVLTIIDGQIVHADRDLKVSGAFAERAASAVSSASR